MNRIINPVILAPSLLGGNHANLAGSAREIRDAGLKWAHVDIMDGHFVDNLTFGPQVLRDVRRDVPELFYDVHLMLNEPHRYIEQFAEAGADLISIHIEPSYDHRGTLQRIRDLGCKTGIVFNPATEWQRVQHLLDEVDLVLVMTVHPGRGGQPFREDVLPKIEGVEEFRQRRNLTFRLEVDGGINEETMQLCKQRGADTFVAGSAFFGAKDRASFVQCFR